MCFCYSSPYFEHTGEQVEICVTLSFEISLQKVGGTYSLDTEKGSCFLSFKFKVLKCFSFLLRSRYAENGSSKIGSYTITSLPDR